MRKLRIERAPVKTGFLASRAIEAPKAATARKALLSRPLAVGGFYDRSAIMQAAICEAPMQRANGSTRTWSQLMSSALGLVWMRAKAAH
jgi:hypothetical protein